MNSSSFLRITTVVGGLMLLLSGVPASVHATYTPHGIEDGYTLCSDGMDNDDDYLIDAQDPDCGDVNTRILSIVKQIVGGTATADLFSFTVTGNGVASLGTFSFEADGENNFYGTPVGSYTVTETPVAGYDATYNNCGTDTDGDNPLTLTKDEIYLEETCTITNTFVGVPVHSTITVTKVVVGNDVYSAEDFPLYVGETAVTTGSETEFDPATYTISESNKIDFTPVFSGDCVADEGYEATINAINDWRAKKDALQNAIDASPEDTEGNAVKEAAIVDINDKILALLNSLSASLVLGEDTDAVCTITNTYISSPVDMCPDDEGIQTSTEECTVPPPVDVCPNDEGVQTSTEECSVPPTDVCPNDEGTQTSVEQCSVPPVDVCSNIQGDQATVPEGYHATEGACFPNGDDGGDGDGDPTDHCANLEGVQSSVPEGMTENDGQCTTESETPKKKGRSGRTNHGSGGGGQVLGASTTAMCEPLLKTYLRHGQENNVDEVTKLQEFLNEYMNAGLPVNGFFGNATDEAVRAFQRKYWEEVLRPWFAVPGSGMSTENDTTGYVFKTTQRHINNMFCPSLNLPVPQLP